MSAEQNQSNAQGGKKKSNIFEYFHSVFEYFVSVFEYFQTFSNVFERFQNKLAHLMRKSALLIEILTHLRINLRHFIPFEKGLIEKIPSHLRYFTPN